MLIKFKIIHFASFIVVIPRRNTAMPDPNRRQLCRDQDSNLLPGLLRPQSRVLSTIRSRPVGMQIKIRILFLFILVTKNFNIYSTAISFPTASALIGTQPRQ